MIKLISFPICPFVQRIAALLEGANIEYEVTYIELSNKPDWFLDISPNAQVPVLITTEGDVLFESDAIADFIYETALAPHSNLSPAARAKEKAWSILATKHYLTQCSTMSSKTEQEYQERFPKLRMAFEKINSALKNDDISSSCQISFLTSAWIALLHRADIVLKHTSIDMLDGLTYLQNWKEKLLEQDWAKKSVSADFEKKFCDFYLNETRYLAHQKKLAKTPTIPKQNCCG